MIGSFLAAMTSFPPDDIVIILLAIAKFSSSKLWITNFLGKLIANLVVICGALITVKALIKQLITQYQSFTNMLILTIVSIIIVGITVYALIKINCGKIVKTMIS